ncbi:MAG: hypothetical protein WKF87_17860 [Chryseolinea sp.]
MEKRLITYQNPQLSNLLKLYDAGLDIIPPFLETATEFEKATGIVIVNNDRHTFSDFMKLTRAIPFSDTRMMKFESDLFKDADDFTEWVLDSWYVMHNGRHTATGLQLTREAFREGLQRPYDLIDELVRRKYEIEYWMRSGVDADLLQYFTIEGGKLQVQPGAREAIIDANTTYATTKQVEFHKAATEALKVLGKLEDQYNVSGMLRESLVRTSKGYQLNPQNLIHIQ